MEPQLTKTVSPAQATIGGIVAFTIRAEFDLSAIQDKVILDDYYDSSCFAFLSASADLPQAGIDVQAVKPKISGHHYRYTVELPLHSPSTIRQQHSQQKEPQLCQMTLSILMAILPGSLAGISRSQAKLQYPAGPKTPPLTVHILPNPLFISSDMQKAAPGASLTYNLTFMNHTAEPVSDLLLALSPGYPSFSFLAGKMIYSGKEAVVLSKNRENSDSSSLASADLQAETGFFAVPWAILPHSTLALVLVYQIGSQVSDGLYSSKAWAEYTQAVPVSHLIITSAAAEVEVNHRLAGAEGVLRPLH
ncbi:MAG: hypothetical protein AAGU12_13800 [Clostridiales bacterium]